MLKQTEPLVSIVIPVYNGSDYLRDAIESALSQTYKNIEVIVIDDGSNDDGATKEIALSFGDRIRYYKKNNGGVATALNMGIDVMKGDYFSWLSHDDLYMPNKVEVQIKAALSFGSPAIVYSNYCNIDLNGNTIQQCKISEKARLSVRCLFAIVSVTGIHGCSLLIPRIAFEKVGKFKAELQYTQDYDLWFEFATHYSFIGVEDYLVQSRQHDGQGSKKMEAAEAADELHYSLIKRLTIEEVIIYSENSIEFLIQGFFMYYFSGYLKTAYQMLKLVIIYALEQGEIERAKLFMNEISALNDLSELNDAKERIAKGMSTENENGSIYDQLNFASRDAKIILKEVTGLLHEVCSKYEATIVALEERSAREKKELEEIIKYHESQNVVAAAAVKYRMRLRERAVRLIKRFARILFKIIKKAVIALGVKDKIRETKFFRKLVNKGIIEKLKGGGYNQ